MSTVSPPPRALPSSAEVVGGLGVVGVAVAAALPVAHIQDGPIVCPFRLLTGLPCPACGMTRSWVYLVHGDVHQAFWSNPFGPVVMLAALVLGATSVVARVRHREPPSLERLAASRWAIALFVLWLLFGVTRIVWILATR